MGGFRRPVQEDIFIIIKIKLVDSMSNNYDSSLLGFLQKPSLFNNSPNNPKRRRSRSRSRDSRVFDQKSNVNTYDDRSIDEPVTQSNRQQAFNYQPTTPKNQQRLDQRPYTPNQEIANRQFAQSNARNQDRVQQRQYGMPLQPASNQFLEGMNRNQQQTNKYAPQIQNPFTPFQDVPASNTNKNYNETINRNFPDNNNRNYQNPAPLAATNNTHTLNDKFMKNPQSNIRYSPALNEPKQYRSQNPASDIRNYQQDYRQSNASRRFQGSPENQIWTGLVSHTNSFESARLQSLQCLDNLSQKIGAQITNINYKIQNFNSKMAKVLNSEFKAIRDKIAQIFEAAFRESDKFIKDYMRIKEQQLAGQLMKIREVLHREHARVETMRDELKKPQWRKVAGQILSSELEKKVEDIVRKSAEGAVGQWELSDLAGTHIKNIEHQLREIIRLKPNK